MDSYIIPLILIISNYLAGSISSAKLITRYKIKTDISKVGFKTAGGSNVAESVGIKWGIVVAAIDIFKGLPVLLFAKYLQVGENWQSLIALAAVIGHCWPVFFKYRGGRGLATFFGTGLILFPRSIIFPLLCFILTIPLWYLRRNKKFSLPILSSPTFTLFGLVLFVFLTLEKQGTTDNIFAIISLIIILLRRITARFNEYKTYHPLKLFLSRLIFDNSEMIK